MSTLRNVQITRYITPLREGGSLPAIVDADDQFKYVIKFRGAGQGTNALIAELIGAEIARALGLRVPELVFAELDAGFGRSEPDEEIQDLLKFSAGTNLGLHYLSGAITFDPAVETVSPREASDIVWLDALLMNMDRTCRNTNMLIWNKELWLIDHGAALYFHHSWQAPEQQALKPFAMISDHVLLGAAADLEGSNERFGALLSPEVVGRIVDLIPDDFLNPGYGFANPDLHRQAYKDFLNIRIKHASIFTEHAIDCRANIV